VSLQRGDPLGHRLATHPKLIGQIRCVQSAGHQRHQWPGGEPSPLVERLGGIPAPSTALNATDAIWQFFTQNRR
jgi:poly(3-hydroxybutyrate) depolymerase